MKNNMFHPWVVSLRENEVPAAYSNSTLSQFRKEIFFVHVFEEGAISFHPMS